MSLYKFNKIDISTQDYIDYSYDLAKNESLLMINEVIPKLLLLEDGESLDLANLSPLSESVFRKNNYLKIPLSEDDFYKSMNHLSYYKRTYVDNLMYNGSINCIEFGGRNFDDEYNIVNSRYKANKFDPQNNTNTIYTIEIAVPESIISNGIIKPGINMSISMGLSFVLYTIATNIFSDLFISKVIESMLDKEIPESIKNGAKMITNHNYLKNTTTSAFALFCEEATSHNTKFAYTIETRLMHGIKGNLNLYRNRILELEIKSYYKH